jgi:hypothetical protein
MTTASIGRKADSRERAQHLLWKLVPVVVGEVEEARLLTALEKVLQLLIHRVRLPLLLDAVTRPKE